MGEKTGQGRAYGSTVNTGMLSKKRKNRKKREKNLKKMKKSGFTVQPDVVRAKNMCYNEKEE